jgi:cobalamin biosynthesis protein CbiG
MTVAVGVGASRGCPVGELEDLVVATLREAGLARGAVDVIASVDVKRDEAAVLALGGAVRFFPAAELARVAVPTPSAVVAAHVGTPSVAEAAALLAAGAGAQLVVDKRRSAHATCAVARSTP